MAVCCSETILVKGWGYHRAAAVEAEESRLHQMEERATSVMGREERQASAGVVQQKQAVVCVAESRASVPAYQNSVD